MFGTSFSEIMIGVLVFIAYFACAAGAIAILWLGAYKFGGWENYGYKNNRVKSWLSVVISVLIGIPIAAAFIMVAIALFTDQDDTTFSHSGGLGENTVCWYELVDDDTVIMAGKTPIIIDGSEKRTVCNLTPEAIPEDVKTGQG